MMFEMFLAMFFTAVVLILIWLARGAVLTPVPLGKGQTMSVVIHAGENASQSLEQTVEALKWLRDNGTLPLCAVIIEDDGMDRESKKLAERLSGSCALVELHTEGKWAL